MGTDGGVPRGAMGVSRFERRWVPRWGAMGTERFDRSLPTLPVLAHKGAHKAAQKDAEDLFFLRHMIIYKLMITIPTSSSGEYV